MHNKYNFTIESLDQKRDLPPKLTVGQVVTETKADVILKLLGYLLFFRERLQLEPRLHDDNIPYTPDLLQQDYELRPILWVECGECSITKLDKLAVKAPESEIWVLKSSANAGEDLIALMKKEKLRRRRYGVIGLEAGMFAEMVALLQPRNQMLWVQSSFDPAQMQFDFNGLWFDSPFSVWRF